MNNPRALDYVLTRRDIRRVWAAVTDDPTISIKDLAAQMKLSRAMTYACLRWLEDEAGYVRCAGQLARDVDVPLFTAFRIVAPPHPGIAASEAD